MAYVAVVDESACVAQGDCVDALPQVFSLQGDVSVVIGTASLEELQAAAEACPTEAISVIDEALLRDAA
jgi:ferredoxin